MSSLIRNIVYKIRRVYKRKRSIEVTSSDMIHHFVVDEEMMAEANDFFGDNYFEIAIKNGFEVVYSSPKLAEDVSDNDFMVDYSIMNSTITDISSISDLDWSWVLPK